ncbi:hypothetical protein [Streptomyces sp. SYSU K21746]
MTPAEAEAPRRVRKPVLWAGAALTAGAAAAALFVLPAGDGDGPGDGGRGPVAVPEADDVLPSVTGTDWVTYADQVVVVRPVAEKEIPPSADEREAGEGYIGRSATLEVDRVLWSRGGAPTAPASVTLDVAGWTFQGDQRREFAVHDSPRLEKGHTYIVALARLQDGTWSALGSSAVLPYDNETIGKGESEGTNHPTPPGGHEAGSVEERVNGKPARSLVDLLKGTAPDPAAAPYASLPPEERYAKAQ